MAGEGKRLEKYSKKQATYEFFSALLQYRQVQKILQDVANLKFDAHLRNFGENFDRALVRIKSCNLERQAIKKKKEKYGALWDLPDAESKVRGMNRTKLKGYYWQFR